MSKGFVWTGWTKAVNEQSVKGYFVFGLTKNGWEISYRPKVLCECD